MPLHAQQCMGVQLMKGLKNAFERFADFCRVTQRFSLRCIYSSDPRNAFISQQRYTAMIMSPCATTRLHVLQHLLLELAGALNLLASIVGAGLAVQGEQIAEVELGCLE